MNHHDLRIKTHGRRELELKLTYPLPKDETRTNYFLDCYLFFPCQLGISEQDRYSVRQFLTDVRSYTRYSPADLSFATLSDTTHALNPLTRILQSIERQRAGNALHPTEVVYELRTFVNVYHHQIRKQGRRCQERIHAAQSDEAATAALDEFLQGSDQALASFRDLRTPLLEKPENASLEQAWSFADEAASLTTEKQIYRFYDLLQKQPDRKRTEEILSDRLGNESNYRLCQGYPSVVDLEDPITNESFVYRQGMLKKWAEACMYMDATPNAAKGRITQILMGIAAGAAMIFAVLATLLASKWFPPNTTPWAILIVAAYIFKDRIKEILRGAFLRILPTLVADRVYDLIDPAVNQRVGSSRARVKFCSPADVPLQVLNARKTEYDPFHSIIPPNNIIHLHNEIRLNAGSLLSNHTRLTSITEILRIQVDRWLARMDNPADQISWMQNGKREQMRASRVYHVHLILAFSQEKGGPATLFHHRVILNRKGIVRVEKLPVGDSPSQP